MRRTIDQSVEILMRAAVERAAVKHRKNEGSSDELKARDKDLCKLSGKQGIAQPLEGIAGK